MDITQALLGTTSGDQNTIKQATLWLENAEKQNLTLFLLALINELATEGKPTAARQAAGLRLKNIFESRNTEVKRQLANQWKAIPANVKTQIRNQCMTTLHSNVKEARSITAILLSTLTAMELSQNQWAEVVQQLVENITKPKSEFGVESSLMTLGYICEDCRAQALLNQANLILTAVIQGMRQDKNNDIRRAATKALLNALGFVKANFANQNERNFIMKTVCEATQSQDSNVRSTSLECLAKIASLYYDHLTPEYMHAIYNVTVKCIKSDTEDVALQAIDFWTTTAEVEADILEEKLYAEQCGTQPEREGKNIIKGVLKPLVTILTEALVNQNEYADDEEWNKSTSAGTCLSYIAKAAGDAVVEVTMPFISQNIDKAEWRLKEAATLAFSAILDGPTSKDKMKLLVNQAIPFMLKHVTHENLLVRDTTVFTIGRIAQFHIESLKDSNFGNIINALIHSLKDEAKVASKASWAIHNIAESFGEEDEVPRNALSPFFQNIVQALLQVTTRDDLDESNLRLNVYEALGAVIRGAATDTRPLLNKICEVIMQKLNETITMSANTGSQREEINMVQGLLCGTLQSITNKLGPEIARYADSLMTLYIKVLKSKPSSVQEDCLVAVGALATSIGPAFEKYMNAFVPHLHAGLRNKQEEIVCSFAVNTVGDLCVALGAKFIPYSDDIVTILLHNLQDNQINRNIKPAIIACFGDIALQVQGYFEKYLKFVGVVLKQASELQVPNPSDEMIDYMNKLRESIFEAYAGILQGLKKEKPAAFVPYVDQLVAFIRVIANDQTIDEIVFKSAIAVIGDLANVYGPKTKQLLSQQFISKLITDGLQSDDKDIQDTAKWVQKQLKKIMSV